MPIESTQTQSRDNQLAELQSIYGAEILYLIDRASHDYLAFYTLMGLRPDHRKVIGDLHEHLASLVQDVYDGGRGKRQTTSCPPQHGKSDVLVRLAIPWLMGARPGMQIGLAAYDYALVEELSMAGQSTVDHPWYGLVFPNAGGLDRSMKRIVNWGTNQGSRCRAVSFGRKLVGRRVDWFIGDDIYPGRDEVERTIIRNKVRRWFFADCMTRLSPGGTVWLVGTRWHPEDLQGYLHSEEYRKSLDAAGMEDEQYHHTNCPAVAEPTEDAPDPLGRTEGQPLSPELGRDEDFLAAVKATQPSYEWDSQYQGVPRVSTAGQVDTARFRYIDSPDQIPETAVFARGWDLAAKDKTIHDWSVGAKCAWDPLSSTFYIADIWRKRLPWPKLRKRIVGLAKAEVDSNQRPVFRIGVEAVGGFEHSYQDLRQDLRGKVKVERRNPRGKDKLTRAMPWFNRVEARQVVLVRGEWNRDFIRELDVFPVGDYDDQVDGVTIAHECLTRRLIIRH